MPGINKPQNVMLRRNDDATSLTARTFFQKRQIFKLIDQPQFGI